jgi:hypothetical protein
MLVIAHRGNVFGPRRDQNPYEENTLESIAYAITHQYGVEIDLWDTPTGLMLGHDAPTHKVQDSFLVGFGIAQEAIFIHCKNIQAVVAAYELGLKNYFFHDKDDCVVTSGGHIWTYPRQRNGEGLYLSKYSIPVIFPNDHEMLYKDQYIWDLPELGKCFGVCTDYAQDLRVIFNNDPVEYKTLEGVEVWKK